MERAAWKVAWAAASVTAWAVVGPVPGALAAGGGIAAKFQAHSQHSHSHLQGTESVLVSGPVEVVEGALNFAIEQAVVGVGVALKVLLGPFVSIVTSFMGRMWEPGDIFFLFGLVAALKLAAKWMRKVVGIGNEAVDSVALMASTGESRPLGRLGKDLVWALEVPLLQMANLLFVSYALDNLANYNLYYATSVNGFEAGRIDGLDWLAASRGAISSALRTTFAGLVALDCVRRFLPRAHFLEVQPEAEPVLRRTLEFTIIGAGLTTVMDVLGCPMQSILAIGGVSGFAIGLASKDVISNFFGGLMLVVLQPFRPGDKIVCDKFVGVVQRIGWYQCDLLKDNRTLQYVPNQIFVSQIVTNISRRTHDYFESTVTLHYDDVAKVPAVLAAIKEKIDASVGLDKNLPVKVYCQAYTDVGAKIHVSGCFNKTREGWRTLDKGNKLIADAVLGCGARFANLS